MSPATATGTLDPLESSPSPSPLPEDATQLETEAEQPSAEMSEIEKIKAAHAARRSRRSRPPLPPSTSVLPPSPKSGADGDDESPPISSDATTTAATTATTTTSTTTSTTTAATDNAEEASLKEELSTLRVELSSLRRNHLQNIKKITEERDMFATALAKQQSQQSGGPTSKKLADVEAQLRAARTRNSDLEAENSTLRDEVKQLKFRVQATKTLDAASDGYNKVVDELVDAKLKCAQLYEEKEDLLRINKELTTTSATLRSSMGELEKSRSEWVIKCADFEKQRAALEERLRLQSATGNRGVADDSSYSGSGLQELKL